MCEIVAQVEFGERRGEVGQLVKSSVVVELNREGGKCSSCLFGKVCTRDRRSISAVKSSFAHEQGGMYPL